MGLTAAQLQLIKNGYLEYRKIKIAALIKKGGPTAAMQVLINALDSKLATRGRIASDTASEQIASQSKAQKGLQADANSTKAREALKKFLVGSGVGGAGLDALALKDELELLAHYACTTYPRVKWIPGPLKEVDKAMSKTTADYDYAWGQNKDLVRGTLACGSQQDLKAIATLIKTVCSDAALGMFLVKQDEQRSVRDGGNSGAGYSGWNFAIQFRDHRQFAAEVQANTFDMMYGKMSQESFCKILKVSAGEYEQLKKRLKLPGGLGHALYDIQDEGRSEASATEQKLARELSLDYNDALRGVFRNSVTIPKINERAVAFWSKLTTDFAKKQWKKAVEGSGEWSDLRKSLSFKFHVSAPSRPVI